MAIAVSNRRTARAQGMDRRVIGAMVHARYFFVAQNKADFRPIAEVKLIYE